MAASSKLKSMVVITASGAAAFLVHCLYKGDERFYREYAIPVLQKVTSPEGSHKSAVRAAKYGLLPRINIHKSPTLQCNLLGLTFESPVGLAAGFDKHGEAMEGLLRLGFGFVEVGSITPEPQPGNPTPRVFRLPEDGAVINRYGFNSDGHEAVLSRLEHYKSKAGSSEYAGPIGVNLGVNKTSSNPTQDYIDGVKKFGCVADYLVINVSSPNTKGVRDMQGRVQLQQLIEGVLKTRDLLDCSRKPAVLIKIAPDLSQQDKEDIAAVVMLKKCRVDGLIATNTTIKRPASLESEHKEEMGGLSGAPLKDMATQTIKDMYQLTEGKIPIIGVGGVADGKDAYDKIRAGASLIQLYTALAYHGPPLANKINRELDNHLRGAGYSCVKEAVGADVDPTKFQPVDMH